MYSQKPSTPSQDPTSSLTLAFRIQTHLRNQIKEKKRHQTKQMYSFSFEHLWTHVTYLSQPLTYIFSRFTQPWRSFFETLDTFFWLCIVSIQINEHLESAERMTIFYFLPEMHAFIGWMSSSADVHLVETYQPIGESDRVPSAAVAEVYLLCHINFVLVHSHHTLTLVCHFCQFVWPNLFFFKDLCRLLDKWQIILLISVGFGPEFHGSWLFYPLDACREGTKKDAP